MLDLPNLFDVGVGGCQVNVLPLLLLLTAHSLRHNAVHCLQGQLYLADAELMGKLVDKERAFL